MSVQKPEYSSKLYSEEICEQEVITEPIERLNFEYIDEVKVSERELIQEMVRFQGIINTENISPPPYDADEMFEFSDNPLEYFASYLPPPEYSPNPEIKLKLLKKFKTQYFLPNYIEARMETGISEEEYNELFWGPVGEYVKVKVRVQLICIIMVQKLLLIFRRILLFRSRKGNLVSSKTGIFQ